MKNKLAIIALLPLLLLTSCEGSYKEVTDYVSNVGAIALRQYGTSGREPLLVDRPNVIYKPSSFNQKDYPDRSYISATTFVLSIWFDYSESIVPTIDWSFSDESCFNVIYPTSSDSPHATVQIVKYPATSQETITVEMVGVIKYNDASSSVSYTLELRYDATQEAYDNA